MRCPFERYGLEQQAEMVRDCFLAGRGNPSGPLTDLSFLPFNKAVTESQQSRG
jgi:hypothetical protein